MNHSSRAFAWTYLIVGFLLVIVTAWAADEFHLYFLYCLTVALALPLAFDIWSLVTPLWISSNEVERLKLLDEKDAIIGSQQATMGRDHPDRPYWEQRLKEIDERLKEIGYGK